jgi:hypothetical protein
VISRLFTAVALVVLAGCSGGSATDPPPDGGSTGGDTGDGTAAPTAAVSEVLLPEATHQRLPKHLEGV